MQPLAKPIALITGIAVALCGAGCAPRAEDWSGRVTNRNISVQVPSVPWPTPDIEAGFRGSAGPGSAGTPAGVASPSRGSTLTVITAIGAWSRLATVAVDVGDTVKEGDVLATLDTAALDAEILAARMEARVAAAQVRVLGDRLSDLAEARTDLDEARENAEDAVAQLLETRKGLVSQRARLSRLLETVENLPRPGTLPPGPIPPDGIPTDTPVPDPSPTLPPQGLPNATDLKAGIARIDVALTRIDQGLAKARRGLSRLSEARSDVAAARATLVELRKLARIAADAAKVPVRMAALHRSVAVVRAPVSGIIVDAARPGDVLAPGATLAVIEPSGPPTVSLWMTPAEAHALTARLRSGQADAYARTDWSGQATAVGRVVHIRPRAQFPPTSFATREIHLTRAVEVILEFPDPPFALPAGAPVDVTIR